MALRLNLRITGPVFFGSLVLLCVGVAGAWYLHRLQKASSSALARSVDSARLAQDLAINSREIRTRINRFLLKKDRGELADLPQLSRDAERLLARSEALAQLPRERDLIRRIQVGNKRFLDQIRRLNGTITADLQRGEIERIRDQVLIKEVLSAANEYLELNQAMAAEASRHNEAVVEWMAFGLLMLGVCGGVAGVLAGYGIARGISSGLVQLSVPVRDVAGKLNTVIGPVTMSGGQSFEEMHQVLETLGEQVGVVVMRLQQSQQQAFRAEQLAAVGQLAAGVAHELRNPLTSMKVLVQSSLERADWEMLAHGDLTVLEEEIGRMEQLIQTFLDFARPPRLQRRPVDLREPVEYIVGMVEKRAERFGTTIRMDLSEAPVSVMADLAQVRQLLLNLLLNALDAVSQGGEVSVSLRREFRDGSARQAEGGSLTGSDEGWGVLEIVDTGCGLPAELGDKIFDPFVSTKTTGVGLGLSISRQIVEAHGGTIAAVSPPSGGAVFTVRLPCVLIQEIPLPASSA